MTVRMYANVRTNGMECIKQEATSSLIQPLMVKDTVYRLITVQEVNSLLITVTKVFLNAILVEPTARAATRAKAIVYNVPTLITLLIGTMNTNAVAMLVSIVSTTHVNHAKLTALIATITLATAIHAMMNQ